MDPARRGQGKRTAPTAGRKGFSLVEILVCLLLALVLLWGVLPRFFRYQRLRNIDHAVIMVRENIALARQEAIRTRRRHELALDRGEQTLAVYDFETRRLVGKVETLPPDIFFREISETLEPLVFRPNGGLAGVSGSIVLADSRSGLARRMIVYGLTGRVRVED